MGLAARTRQWYNSGKVRGQKMRMLMEHMPAGRTAVRPAFRLQMRAKPVLRKASLAGLALLGILLCILAGMVLLPSRVWPPPAAYGGTIMQRILIAVHGGAGASSELSLLKDPLEKWGYTVDVFDRTECYDLLGGGDHWYLKDQGGGHGNLDLVVGGNMRYSVIIFDSGDGRSYTDLETPQGAVRQMFRQYPFLGMARMESGLTPDGTMENLFRISTSGNAVKSLTVRNPAGTWALQPLVGYTTTGSSWGFTAITGKRGDVTVLESFDDGSPALTLTSYASGARAIYFAFKDWGYSAHVTMVVRLIQEYSGMPCIKPYYSFEVDDCGMPEAANADYIGLCRWTRSNLGGYPTLAFVEAFLDPDPPPNVLVHGLDPSHYYSESRFVPDNVALLAALRGYDDHVVAAHGYQHDVDWWVWKDTSLPVDPYADQDRDGLPNWKDPDLEGAGVNNNDNPRLAMVSVGSFIEPDLDLQRLWLQRMRELLDYYGFSGARVLIAPKFEYLDHYTNSLAAGNGFDVISGRAANRGFEMALGWVDGIYAPGRVAPAVVGNKADTALTAAERQAYSVQFMGYLGVQPLLCLITNHMWQFAQGDTPGYELRDSYLSSYSVMKQGGFSLVSTQTGARKSIGWLWTRMSSVRTAPGAIDLTLDSSAFQDGRKRHELDLVMPFSIGRVTVGGKYWICVDGSSLLYGKRSGATETLEVRSGAWDPSVPRISAISTPATDVLDATYDPDTGKISLTLDGTFTTTLRVSSFGRPFSLGTTSIGADGSEVLTIDLSGEVSAESVNMSVVPSSGSIAVAVQAWNTLGNGLRQWTESGAAPGVCTAHTVGDLAPGASYSLWYSRGGEGKTLWQTLTADASGQVSFTWDQGGPVQFELEAAS